MTTSSPGTISGLNSPSYHSFLSPGWADYQQATLLQSRYAIAQYPHSSEESFMHPKTNSDRLCLSLLRV
ncbi:MAG: hypothetical protein QNJ63_21660 [Calothrix sp. MO_192.B10]|nr:hypothetical protein [Calothrix sp. MO_192.B10]